MIKAILVLSIILAGCVHRVAPPCVSYCGMLIEDKGNGSMSCDVIKDAERTWLDGADDRFCLKDKRFCKAKACKQIFGWQLRLDENVITVIQMEDGKAHSAVGLSNCDTKEMWLGANQDWRHGAYPHEMFHVAQECNSGYKPDGSESDHGAGHDGWDKAGIYDFIKDLRQ